MLALKPTAPTYFATARPAYASSTAEDEIESMEAQLGAILVDLEARAKYGKIEGLAVPLLVRAKSVKDSIAQRLASASDDTRKRYGADCARLTGQLRTVALALAYLCRTTPAHSR